MNDDVVRTYVCEGCHTAFEGTEKQAFELGWDTPERFVSHCTCPKCPINLTVWWKLVVKKEEPTDEEIRLIFSYNQLYEERWGHPFDPEASLPYTTEQE